MLLSVAVSLRLLHVNPQLSLFTSQYIFMCAPHRLGQSQDIPYVKGPFTQQYNVLQRIHRYRKYYITWQYDI